MTVLTRDHNHAAAFTTASAVVGGATRGTRRSGAPAGPRLGWRDRRFGGNQHFNDFPSLLNSLHPSKYFGRLDPIQDLKSTAIGRISAAVGAAQKGLAQPNLLHRSNRRHAMCRNIVESQPVADQIAALVDTKAGTYRSFFSLRHLSRF